MLCSFYSLMNNKVLYAGIFNIYQSASKHMTEALSFIISVFFSFKFSQNFILFLSTLSLLTDQWPPH